MEPLPNSAKSSPNLLTGRQRVGGASHINVGRVADRMQANDRAPSPVRGCLTCIFLENPANLHKPLCKGSSSANRASVAVRQACSEGPEGCRVRPGNRERAECNCQTTSFQTDVHPRGLGLRMLTDRCVGYAFLPILSQLYVLPTPDPAHPPIERPGSPRASV